MAVSKEDVIKVDYLLDVDMSTCAENTTFLCETMKDRSDLHDRSYMERYIDIFMGEVAETAVINWLNKNGKYAVSAVDKKSGKPDKGHDIFLKDKYGREIKGSVKSSLSAKKSNIDDILKIFTIATKKSELRQVNIQVYYWLDIDNKEGHRTTVPSTDNMAIIGWIGDKDVTDFTTYNKEERESPKDKKLKDTRTMQSLLDFLS